MQRRAYAFIDVKAFDPETRSFSGLATTPAMDRVGDIIEPQGVKFANPLPLLLYHDSEKPVGEVRFKHPTASGVPFDATISSIDRPGVVKDRLDEAMDSLRANPPLIRGVSIGFRPLEAPVYNRETDGLTFPSIEVYELSMVVIPANAEATIANLKSFDRPRAASGTPRPVVKLLPGASGSSRVTTRPSAPMKKSYADQIATWEATRKSKTDRMDEILAKSADAGTTLDAADKEEHDTLEGETKDIDDTIRRLRSAEEREKAAAKPVDGSSAAAASQSRSHIVVAKKELPKGVGFAQMAMCVAMARGVQSDALAFAKQYYPQDSMIEKAILGMRAKAAVGAGAVVTSHWADDLVPYNVLSADFIEYLRAGNIVDKFGAANPGGGPDYPALRKVPFNIRVSGFSAGLTGNWVGEGKPAPMSKATSFNTTLTWAKVEALTALTKEEIRFSNPSAEAKVRDDIARAINTRIDIDFVDPAKAAVANVSPASITDSIVATAPTAATAAALITDLASLIKPFAQNNLSPNDIVLIMSAQMALQISMMTTSLGMPYFPNITMQGGFLRGFPVLVSENLTSVGSPSTQTIVAAKASEIYLADDGNVSVDASDQASLEMLDSSMVQDGTAGTGTSLVSLWQNGLVGILAQREITWKLRRSTAVQYISPAAYAA